MNSKSQVLWADDDNDDEGIINGLLLFFEAVDVTPVRAHGFDDGERKLEKLTKQHDSVTLLSDVVLPQALGMGALAWDLGIRLAFRAAELGVRRVGFLTVVEENEVREKLEPLKEFECEWKIFSKLTLLDGDNIQRLVEFMT